MKTRKTYNNGIWEESEGSVALLAAGKERERERKRDRERISLEDGALLILKQCAQTRLN